MLTRQQKQDYIDNEAQHCPYCKGEGGVWGMSLYASGSRVEQEMECSDCDKTWTDIFELKDIEEN